jgi:hypothetical protein
MASYYYTDWQAEQMGCACEYHRYEVAHICECGALHSDSPADSDAHRAHDGLTFDSKLVKHGDSARDVFDRLQVIGLLPYGTEAYGKVYDYMADHQERMVKHERRTQVRAAQRSQ